MVAAVAAVAAVGGAAISSQGAKSAANTQADAANAANMAQMAQFNKTVELQQPAINAGNAARDRLTYLLGLSPRGVSAGAPQTYDSLYNQLKNDYTTYSPGTPASGGGSYSNGTSVTTLPQSYPGAPANDVNSTLAYFQSRMQPSTLPPGTVTTDTVYPGAGAGVGPGYWGPDAGATGARTWIPGTTGGTGPTSQVDTAGLNAAVQSRLAQQAADLKAQQDAAASDPLYGSLAKGFEFDKFTPDTYEAATPFSYTGEDLYKDPSYQFRLEQGQKALDRQGAASGRFLSGAQLQSASDYNQGAASQEFQNAYQRALGTYGTNETNRLNTFNTNETNKYNAFNTNETNRYNAYQSNFTNAVNPLLSLAGSATLGSQMLGQQGLQNAQIIGNNTMGAANAGAAGTIASNNAINSGLNNAVSGYQSNQLLNQLLGKNGGINNNPYGASGGSAYSSPSWDNWATGTGGMGD